MSSVGTEQKITEILTLIGVSPRYRQRAAANFRNMSDQEIDVRLARLHAGERRIENWRTERDQSQCTPLSGSR